jgi:hypothetical protein
VLISSFPSSAPPAHYAQRSTFLSHMVSSLCPGCISELLPLNLLSLGLMAPALPNPVARPPIGNKNCVVKVAIATDANGVTERTMPARFAVSYLAARMPGTASRCQPAATLLQLPVPHTTVHLCCITWQAPPNPGAINGPVEAAPPYPATVSFDSGQDKCANPPCTAKVCMWGRGSLTAVHSLGLRGRFIC